jgi:hypothetical protein
MRRLRLAGSTAIGIVIGGALFNSVPAFADLPVIDPTAIAQEIKSVAQETGILNVLTAMQTVQSTINDGITAFNKAIGLNTYGDTNTLLRLGFTQNANYAKAQIGAQQQITDASNTAMARFQRDVRNASIRDQQTASPTACTAIDGGVSTQAAAIQAFQVGATIADIHDKRGEAGPGMPSHFGQGEGIASMAAEHLNLYCNADDAAANLCAAALPTADYDQKSLSLFGSGTYADQTAVNTAKDYAINLIEPVAPAALRGDQLNSVSGQDAAVRRRSYNARMSLAQTFVDNAIGMQTPSVPLTALQQQYLQEQGLPAQTNGSWYQVLQIEAQRRFNSISWNADLQSMPPASVEREIALEAAETNYLLFEIFKTNLQHATMTAAQLAEQTNHDFMPTARIPTPSVASNAP